MNKRDRRKRRARKTRGKIRELRAHRLCIPRTPRHMYAQLIAPDGGILATASTLQKDVRAGLKGTGNKDAAVVVGKNIAERAKALGIEQVAFDRAGFRYHGRVQALADSARENGLKF